MYEVGDKVVYPHHGAGKIVKKEKKEVLGQKREYLTIQILYNDMTVMVPTENADQAGLRKVIGEETVEEVLAVLRDDGTQMPKNWNRRFKHNRDKIKTGDIFELAEVVRNLSIRDLDKGLSTGEKQMFGRAKKILASELMYARDMEEQEATDFLENLLEDIGRSRVADERSDGAARRRGAGRLAGPRAAYRASSTGQQSGSRTRREGIARAMTSTRPHRRRA